MTDELQDGGGQESEEPEAQGPPKRKSRAPKKAKPQKLQDGEGAPPQEAEPEVPEPEEVKLLREKMEEALREKDQFRALAQRSQADLANYRRRVAEEMDELRISANGRLLLKMVATVDDLDRAISLLPQDAVAPGWLDGLLLVLRGINQVLESEGVTKMTAVGKPFDPFEFEAVQYEETTERDEGTITRVLREGYKHHDKVLRAAQVVVAKQPETLGQSETIEEEPK